MTYAPPPPGDATPPEPTPPSAPPPAATAPTANPSLAKPSDNAQLYGIIGVITAFFCCPPLGILFGWMSMTEARKLGRDDTLGKVAFWAGLVVTVGWLIGGILTVCFGGFGAFSNSNW